MYPQGRVYRVARFFLLFKCDLTTRDFALDKNSNDICCSFMHKDVVALIDCSKDKIVEVIYANSKGILIGQRNQRFEM